MVDSPSFRRTIGSYVPPRAYAPGTRAALEKLGYRMVPASTPRQARDERCLPDLRIVDERHVHLIPPEEDRTPLVLLTATSRAGDKDPRIVGYAPRPATLEVLFPILQCALENTPRTVVRASTELPGSCVRADQRWAGAVLSLSELGCLIRTSEPMASGLEFDLIFPLPLHPAGRMMSTRARVIEQCGEGVAMAFEEMPNAERQAVSEYVKGRLTGR